MAKIVSFNDGGNFNVVYSINISDEELKLLRTSEEGTRLIQECNMNRGILTRSALSELSDAVNKELQRLQSLAHVENRRANLANAESRRVQCLELYQSQKLNRR